MGFVSGAVRRRLKKHLLAATVVANLVLVTHALWEPIDDVAAVAAASLAAALQKVEPGTLDFATTAIVKIGPQRFADTYKGTSPLDRCELTKDLEQVLARSAIRTVSVDLDLSPTERAEATEWTAQSCRVPMTVTDTELATKSAAEREHTCQCRLNDLVRKNAARLVLMKPGPSWATVTQTSITNWYLEYTSQGLVSFGDGDLQVTRGIVREHRPLDDSKLIALGDATYRHIQRERLRARSNDDRPNPWDGNAPADAYAGGIVAAPIPFHALKGLYAAGNDLQPDSPCFAKDGKECQIHAVLFGAGYSPDDKFATPIGTLDGVDVHAAIAACPVPSRSREGLLHVGTYVAEVLLGALLLGPLFAGCWKRYFRTVTGELPRPTALRPTGFARVKWWLTPAHPDTAYGWLVWMAVAVVIGLLVLVIGVPVLANAASPDLCRVPGLSAAFVVGMVLEAAVLQGAEAAHHQVAPHPAEPTLAPCEWCRGLPWQLYAALFGFALPALLVPH